MKLWEPNSSVPLPIEPNRYYCQCQKTLLNGTEEKRQDMQVWPHGVEFTWG